MIVKFLRPECGQLALKGNFVVKVAGKTLRLVAAARLVHGSRLAEIAAVLAGIFAAAAGIEHGEFAAVIHYHGLDGRMSNRSARLHSPLAGA